MKLINIPDHPASCRNLIGGEWQIPSPNKTLDIISPYTGRSLGTVPLSTAADVELAVQKAAEAFPGWRQTPIKERCAILFRFREQLLSHLDLLSHTAASEAGKTVDEARAGVMKGVEVVEFALSLQNLDAGQIMEVSRGVTCEYRREPLGVVAGITPFNFPAMVPLWMYPIALALGNCFILKPSEKVPLTSQIIGDLFGRAGLPKGVFSIVNGAQECANAIIDHPLVHAVAFVGSTPVAKSVYTRTTALGKRALCLGGAKNSVIVTPDADPQITIPGVVASFTGCAGQRCMAASLLIAVGDVDSLIEGIRARAATLETGCALGAIISASARERIAATISAAQRAGATVLLDGRNPKPPAGYEGGFWLGPTIIDRATPDMECSTVEIFGPVLTIIRVRDLSEALALERRCVYGNATSVFTTRGSVAQRVADAATAGMIGVNIGVPVPREPFSFGGRKQSKFGHGDITGEASLDFWSDRKKITSKWEPQRDTSWMG